LGTPGVSIGCAIRLRPMVVVRQKYGIGAVEKAPCATPLLLDRGATTPMRSHYGYVRLGVIARQREGCGQAGGHERMIPRSYSSFVTHDMAPP